MALLERDLNKISAWAKNWLVNFNTEKTKEMIISNKLDLDQHLPLIFNRKSVTRVDTHSHLGILLSSNLKWTAHIDELLNKTS